ncbi:MAG: hypothetical protein H6597_04685 [Flavobacteriales bacterium]|nr:hypothetical protein [Flavobacteriales bacterium]MCB9193810.1 hypothetical protein [Flavobacteriales bacterium]
MDLGSQCVAGLAGLLFTMTLHAQDTANVRNERMYTLFASGQHTVHGGWGAPAAAATRILDQDAMLAGIKAGWIIDHRLTFGIAGYGLVTDVKSPGYDAYLADEGILTEGPSLFRMGYGGLFLEPVIAYRSPVHISLPIIVGAGGCGHQYTTRTRPVHEQDRFRYGTDGTAFFVAEPGIDLELNVLRILRFGVGASYRYATDLDLEGVPDDALRGLNLTASLKVGVF